MSDLAHEEVDLTNEDIQQCPYEAYKKLREQALRQAHRQNDVITKGDIVMSARTGDKGTVHRTGVNYAIVVTEDGRMFREWVKDIRAINRP